MALNPIFFYRKMTEEFDEDSADYPLVTPGKQRLLLFQEDSCKYVEK